MELIHLTFPVAFALDAILGDPVYPLHPIRVMGHAITRLEAKLFARGLNTKLGGVLLTIAMLLLFAYPTWALHHWLWLHAHALAFCFDVYCIFHCLALKDLIAHANRIGDAVVEDDLPKARKAASMLVGRDTEPMDKAACCRAAIESLSENLADGVIAPMFWYVLLGVPGMVAFKVASTLDSMVGFKSERYLKFGWAGARLDDMMNYIPARLTWLGTVLVAMVFHGYSARKAWRVGLAQHSRVPGPNSGWSETAFAGALQLRIAGPIYKGGSLVTDVWLGEDADQSEVTPADIKRAAALAFWVSWGFLIATLPLWAR